MRTFALVVLLGSAGCATAQSTAVLNQRLGACAAQSDRVKRMQCFEGLANDAVAQLNAQSIVTPVPQGPKPEPLAPKVSKYADAVTKAKEAVARQLKDPLSIQWNNLFVSEKHFIALCGEFNGKNSYGGYIGFRRFVSVPSQELVMTDSQESASVSSLFASQWNMFCMNEVEAVN